MAFENNRDRDRSRDRNRSGFSGNRSQGSQNNGRIENFEKPLIQLLKEINEKLDILIEKK
ncbi:hypothetical protein [Spiroplasma taiwanense]|uniref:Uncharacterized protein n=1 Tax=Spiroplasma taiwanense CT-1 TaxID=1276220 RepID=S5MGU5_9MOLU|nr:hypothetical protein [Spiroplasma taiwanense]AGR41070.1 hypothetical protein STAIW_v1c04240 [Spiroplasma taiwanense CT-1]